MLGASLHTKVEAALLSLEPQRPCSASAVHSWNRVAQPAQLEVGRSSGAIGEASLHVILGWESICAWAPHDLLTSFYNVHL